eukprot:1157510-Pelagomonas_calceolata.AAC.9
MGKFNLACGPLKCGVCSLLLVFRAFTLVRYKKGQGRAAPKSKQGTLNSPRQSRRQQGHTKQVMEVKEVEGVLESKQLTASLSVKGRSSCKKGNKGNIVALIDQLKHIKR